VTEKAFIDWNKSVRQTHRWLSIVFTIARPRISSLLPREYRLAVSKKLMPPSRARWMNGRLSASSMPQA
jgi:hypothetical protein